jgi:hypothetical protein
MRKLFSTFVLLLIVLTSNLFGLNRDEIWNTALAYCNLEWYNYYANWAANYDPENTDPQLGYTDEHPCFWDGDYLNTWLVGMPYHYGGKDDFEDWNNDFVCGYNGAGAWDVHYPGSLTWAAGIDCSGLVGRCWQIDEYTIVMYFNCTYIQNNYYIIDKPQIEKGDVIVKAGEHVFIYESGANDRYDIVHGAEANVSPPDDPVNSHCYEFNPDIDLYLDFLGYVLRSYFDPNCSVEPGEPTETTVPILHQNFF